MSEPEPEREWPEPRFLVSVRSLRAGQAATSQTLVSDYKHGNRNADKQTNIVQVKCLNKSRIEKKVKARPWAAQNCRENTEISHN